ncbi:MAG: DUF1211 domain-containing protein [Flavobacteriales bacterium]|nr:DUF1211 domain-containing protein [Flavobacteriales bacterium]
MFNNNLRKNRHISPTGFRYRGVESSRLEHLTDAVFAFAITLLVIASEVPRSYVELQASMYNFIGFIACSLLLLGLWSNHSNFFMNYGMQDRATKILNFIFLFVLLFYIYPLKYLFSHLSNLIWVNYIGKDGLSSESFTIAYNKAIEGQLTTAQWQDLMLRFGAGLLLIYLVLVSMHINAIRRKKELSLNNQEIYETKFHIINYVFLCVICILSMSIVVITGGNGSGISGSVFLLIPILLPILRKIHHKKLKEKFPNSFERNSSVVKKEENRADENSQLNLKKEKKKKAKKEKAKKKAKVQSSKKVIDDNFLIETNENDDGGTGVIEQKGKTND